MSTNIRRIDELGRIAIPRDIRRAYKVHEGTAFEIQQTKQGILLIPHIDNHIERIKAINNLAHNFKQFCTEHHIDADLYIADNEGNDMSEHCMVDKMNDETKAAFQAFAKDTCTAYIDYDTPSDQNLKPEHIWRKFNCLHNAFGKKDNIYVRITSFNGHISELHTALEVLCLTCQSEINAVYAI